MAKKKQFVTAAAAFAVAASAVAPAITADAASTTVQLASDYVRGGDLDAALDKEYKGSEIYWYKSSVDMNKLGVFQTAKGFVKGQGIRVEKKLRVLNHAQDIQPEEIVLEEGVPASGLRIQPVLFADGVKYNKVVTYAGFSTEKAGEFEGTFTYSNKAFGVVTKTVKYKVVKSEVEISNVSSSVDQAAEVLSVTADVKNLKEGEKVELVVYPGKDMSATPIKADATVKDGKLTVSKKLPAGTHSFQLVSGEVKSAVVDFTIEAPMVKEVKAINAKELVIKFNKAINDASIIESDGTLVDNKITINSLDGVAVTTSSAIASLNADKTELTIKASGNEKLSGRYDVKFDKGAVKTVSGEDIASYSTTITAEDKVAPSLLGTEQLNASQVKVKFSEPLLTAGTVTFKYADGSEVAAGAITGTHTAGNDYVTYTLSGVAAGKTVVASFVGAQDYAGNLMSPNPSTASLYKGNLDGAKPVVSSISVLNGSKFEVKFSEQLQTLPTVTVGGTAATVKQDSTDKTKYIATLATPVKDLQTVVVSSFTDLSGEVGENYSKVVNFSVDTTAPKLTSTRLVTDAKDAKQYLELTFDENVKLGSLTQLAVTGNYVKDYITKQLTTVNVAKANILPVEGTDNVFRILASNLVLLGEDFEGATYNLTLTGDNEIVVDGSGNKGAAVITSSFTRGKDGTVTTTNKPVVKSVAEGANNNEVVVTFDKEVDGASAINTSNYVVNGAVVEKATLSAYDNGAGEQVVTLTLKADSNAFSGDRYVTISGVKAKNGVQMDVDNRIVDLDENVRPTITSAKLTDTQTFNLTFSEKVYNAANVAADFELYVGNVKSAKTLTVEVVADAASAKSQLVVTVDGGVTADELSKGLSIKPATGLDIVDTEGNKANVTAVTIN